MAFGVCHAFAVIGFVADGTNDRPADQAAVAGSGRFVRPADTIPPPDRATPRESGLVPGFAQRHKMHVLFSPDRA